MIGFYRESQIFENTEYSIARVAAVDKNQFLIRDEKTTVAAEVTGKFIYDAESILDLPTVGDWVKVQYFDKKTFAIIHSILPRKSLLKRKMAGNKVEFQSIAANIDTAFIMQAADYDFNISRLERYLTMINEAGIKPVILLSKIDLISIGCFKK